MPMKRELYPEDWEQISLGVKERAGWQCEWCGVKHGGIGARDINGQWHNENDIHQMNATVGHALFGQFPNMIQIILTAAHLGVARPDGSPGDKHNKMDCRPENLAALCQKCHLNYDREDHQANAAKTRRRRKIEAGQIPLPTCED